MLDKGRTDPPRSADSPSLRVVEAVADADGVDPTDVEPPLHDAVDAAALDRLFESTARATPRTGRVSFSYRGYDVTVHADGRVELE
ncbi:HalOD1 output domain-containing protein [Halosolutus amylolyticus]|uniref:HalOD1 output domain-containing protein n=1 Tax=Halosolutus amylolyticus TaxID=2932267 RepID=A0ABD5PLP1_9EURY|nr:HalOD1 output domain-containing protein [Halosolutus amylolyticus]